MKLCENSVFSVNCIRYCLAKVKFLYLLRAVD